MSNELIGGKYRLGRLLGRGGCAEVRVGEHVVTRGLVAIKRWHDTLDATQHQRFLTEAQASAAIAHPGLVAIHDVGADDRDRPFLVMELLEGRNLRELLQDGPLPLNEALDIFGQLVRVCAVAHELGFVHRDIKPENVFVTYDGRVKLLDFGLSLVGAPRPQRLTPKGYIIGTRGYSSPEQLAQGRVDPSSDVWSLGAVFYEMVCGKRPFAGLDDVDEMAKTIAGSYVSLRQRVPDMPVMLAGVIDSCLRHDPEARYGSAMQLRDAFSFAVAHHHKVEVVARLADHPEPNPVQKQRRSAVLVLCGSTMLLSAFCCLTSDVLVIPLLTGNFGSTVMHATWTPLARLTCSAAFAISASAAAIAMRRRVGLK